MKNNRLSYLLAMLMTSVVMLVLVTACNDDNGGGPEIGITAITDEDGNAITNVALGQTIFIEGFGLLEALIEINALAVTPATITNESITIEITSAIPTIATDPDVTNELVVTIPGAGEAGADLVIVNALTVLPGAPEISSISNEFAPAGEELVITGQYFFFVQDVVFPGGVSATAFTASADGTTVTATVPTVTEAGEVRVVTLSGDGGSMPRNTFMDRSGVILDGDDHLYFQDWGVGGFTEGGFDGNYINVATADAVAPESWWVGSSAFVADGSQDSTMATPNGYSGPAADYVLRMEVNVPASKPWSSGWFELATNVGDGEYFGRLMPWTSPWTNDSDDFVWYLPNSADVGTSSFHTDGKWVTIDYPMNWFAPKESGTPSGPTVADISELTANYDGFFWIRFAFQNPNEGAEPGGNGGTAMPAGLDISIDNIRIVKITN